VEDRRQDRRRGRPGGWIVTLLPAFLVWVAPGDPLEAASGNRPSSPSPSRGGEEPVVRIDHVVVAVADLAAAERDYRDLGFRVGPGRMHESGLENRHVEFRDGTEIELMALRRPPTDDIARSYEDFLATSGEGGAYLAFTGTQSTVAAAAERIGVTAMRSAGGGFRYVTFREPELAAVFVVEYPAGDNPPDREAGHPNGATRTSAVWVEGGERLETLIVALGARPAGTVALPEGGVGSAFSLGEVTVVVAEPGGDRPRVLGIECRTESGQSRVLPPERTHGLRLSLLGAGESR
jgi:catechol 2,3-dioxygenase-like lactoylglutathione lyase family enzyme